MKRNYNYVSPETSIIAMDPNESVMIEIGSGNTSPEESDSNSFYFDDEEGNLPKSESLWDR